MVKPRAAASSDVGTSAGSQRQKAASSVPPPKPPPQQRPPRGRWSAKGEAQRNIESGICSYAGCPNRTRNVDVDSQHKVIECEAHFKTWDKGYKYYAAELCRDKYNADPAFQDSFDGTHGVVVGGNPKEFEGAVDVGQLTECYQGCEKVCGMWTLAASTYI